MEIAFDNLTAAIQGAQLVERARIVEWLREYGSHGITGEENCIRCQIANAIERGDHTTPTTESE